MPASLEPDLTLNPVARVDDVAVTLGGRPVLNGVSLAVEQGEIFVIMGPSGSGKSTLFRTMLGLTPPAAGRISLFGRGLHDLPPERLLAMRKHIGVAFQGGALLNSMTVLENVELPLTRHTDLAPNTIRIMSRMKLEMMNLTDVEDRYPSELSGGMLKRASLARAVIMDPKLLFFDEPSAGLDPISAAELDEHILNLRDAHHMTIVVVTHELHSALKIADRIAVLDSGGIVAIGDPKTIQHTPHPVVNNLFSRRPGSHDGRLDDYLDRLTH